MNKYYFSVFLAVSVFVILGGSYFFLGPIVDSSRNFLASVLPGSFGPGAFTLDPLEASCSGQAPAVRLHWSTSENVASYILQRKPASQDSWGNSKISGTIPAEDQDYLDTDLPSFDASYSYRLRASKNGNNVFSNIQNVDVKNCVVVINASTSEATSTTSSSTPLSTTIGSALNTTPTSVTPPPTPTSSVKTPTSTPLTVAPAPVTTATTTVAPSPLISQTPSSTVISAAKTQPVVVSTPTLTQTASTQTVSTKFVMGDRVKVRLDRPVLNVRSTPYISGIVIGTQSAGALGTIVGGPSYDSVDKYWFWKVNYDSGSDGWSVEYWIDKTSTPAPAPTPTPTPTSTVDVTAPTVSIANPFNGVVVSGTIAMGANALDNVGVAAVEFYVDGLLQFNDSSTPYSYSWNTNGLTNASHTIFAKARDAAGNLGQSPTITVSVNNAVLPPQDITPPSVSLTLPTANAMVSSTVKLAANASDNVGVSVVEFFIDGLLKFSASLSPYSYNWDTTGIADGLHTIFAKARDAAGNIMQSIAINVTVNNSVPSPTPTSTPKLWGAYTGWYDTSLPNFETKVGKAANTQTLFVHWGNENQFPPASITTPLKNNGKTLIIFWDSMDYTVLSTNQPRFSMDSIIAGNWDSYILSFASSARAYGGPVIIIPFEEMNGNWDPWSGTLNGNTPAKVMEAYRHIRTTFGNVPNVKWGIALNSNSVPDTAGNALELYYPGDAYVDYVGIDGFNFGSPWLSFSQVFDAPLAKLKRFGKPIYIFSMASAEGSSGQKAAWITDALKVQIPKHPEIAGWVWFNEAKEQNWLVWSTTAALDAFKAAVQ